MFKDRESALSKNKSGRGPCPRSRFSGGARLPSSLFLIVVLALAAASSGCARFAQRTPQDHARTFDSIPSVSQSPPLSRLRVVQLAQRYGSHARATQP